MCLGDLHVDCQILKFGAAVLALLAAGFWLRSATVKIFDHPKNGKTPGGISLIDRFGVDVIATARAQSAWSAAAAIAAACAAMLQALSTA